jgi:hypothetical protein
LGADKECKADVQVIAASNVDLSARVASQRFRADLYFRLDVLHVHIPPLRDRLCDLRALAYRFLEKLRSPTLREKRLSSGALDYLASYQWPGNVRELSNVIQRAAVLSDGNTIQRSDIALGVQDAPDRESEASFSERRARAIADFEWAFVQRALEEHRGNVTHAAQATGKDRRVFGRLIKKYDIRWSADSVGPCSPTGGTIRFRARSHCFRWRPPPACVGPGLRSPTARRAVRVKAKQTKARRSGVRNATRSRQGDVSDIQEIYEDLQGCPELLSPLSRRCR